MKYHFTPNRLLKIKRKKAITPNNDRDVGEKDPSTLFLEVQSVTGFFESNTATSIRIRNAFAVPTPGNMLHRTKTQFINTYVPDD